MASSDEKILRGKVALVTGGSRGIGRAIAAAYVQNGASVFLCGRNADDIGAALREIRQIDGAIDGITGDVGRPQDVEKIVSKTVQRFGGIDVLVNNASILGPREPIANYPLAAWDDVIQINLTGVFLVTRAVLPIMLERRSGSIINVTSGVGRRGKARWGAYAVSKAGLECFTQVLADEVSQTGIRVNSVNPAGTRTRMRAEAYPAEDPLALPVAEEITPVFVYLASDASAGVTGQSLEARDWLRRKI
jgi:NAD(P)-dependent dehydrogenase (short-subunit alcohol dehydrogenase family)